jgi:PAS domain S-box-containing protein
MSHQEDYSSFFGREDKPIESEPEMEAYREKVIAAERESGGIRALIILLNAIVFFLLSETGYFVPEKIEVHSILAYIILGISLVYSIFTWLFKPYEHYPVMLASYFSYVSDMMFITLWLYATGGFASPFYTLWYVAIAIVAFRFNWRIVWATSLLYIVCYVALVLLLSQVHTAAQVVDLALRCIYIAAIGYIASLISKETYVQTKEKLQLKNITRSLLLTQRELEEKKEALEDLTRLLEDRVTERTRDLEANAKNFSMLLDSIHLLTWTTTPEGKVNYYNKAWGEFFKGSVDGNDLSAFVHPDDVAEVRSRWMGVKDTGIPAEGHFRWKRHDGEWRDMQVQIICLKNEEEEIIMWIGTATDISGQKH